MQSPFRRGERFTAPLLAPALLFAALCLLGSYTAVGQDADEDPELLALIARAQTSCNGTVSLNKQCNLTQFSYPSGCQTEIPAEFCLDPLQGQVCSELPEHNATCLIPISCSSFDLPANSFRRNEEWPTFGEALEIVCNAGYERSDAKGFETRAFCTDTGNFTEMEAPDFECVRVSCGQYCRYCRGSAIRVDTDPKIVMQYVDEFGERCCLTRPDPLFDNSDDGRNNPVVTDGVVLRPWTVRYNERITIVCNSGYDAVPAWGTKEPLCVPRTDCSWQEPDDPEVSNGWNTACQYVRGRYETGAVCKRVLSNVTFSYLSTPTVPCQASAEECEFPESVQISLSTAEAGVGIYWRYEDEGTPELDMPVRAPTGTSVSTMAGSASLWEEVPIQISASKSGCNVITQFRTINAVAVKDGRPNSIVSVSPLVKVTATNGRMPANMSTCPGTFPSPATDAQQRVLRPSQMFGGCMAYRFFAFVPVALADTQADAMALSELTFRFKGRVVEGGVASTAGVCPAAESPRYLTDRDPMSKMLTLTNCWILIDFNRAVAVDAFEVGTSNDCTSRDPVRWMILASPDAERWVLLDDQTTSSFAMPLVRNAYAPEQDLPLLVPAGTTGNFQNVSVRDTTKVGNALNRIVVEITVEDDSGNVVAPPIGTRFVLGGLVSRLSAADPDFPIHSQFLGPPEHTAPSIVPKGRWFRDTDRVWKVEFVVGQCLPREPFQLSFLFINPPVTSPTTVGARRTLFIEGLDSMAIPNQAYFNVDILRGGQAVQVPRMEAVEASNVQGIFNTISLRFYFTAPPMAGTEIIVDNLLGSMSGSDPQLPVTWELEDGSRVLGVGNFDKVQGRLVTVMPVDSVEVCRPDGTCGRPDGLFALNIVFQIYNPVSLQEPWTLEAFVNFCPKPATFGCMQNELQVVGPLLSEGDVLGGVQACLPSTRLDNCSVCDGDDTLCKGCDGVVNSGAVVDLCGECGGGDSCVGCDGVVNSGVVIDRCGVCNGTNECEVVLQDIEVVDWSNFALNLTIINAPGRTVITDAEVFGIKESVAGVIDFEAAAVDVLRITDAPEGKALVDVRRHIHPEHFVVLSKRPRLPGEAVCTVDRSAIFGCAINEGPEAFEQIIVPTARFRPQTANSSAESSPASLSLQRRLLQTGGNPPPTGLIDVWLRFNFGKDSAMLEKAVLLEEKILSGELSDQLTRSGLCNASGQPCRALIFDKIQVNPQDPLVIEEPPPPPPESDLVTVIIIVSSVVGVLVLCGCVLLARWRGLVKERRANIGYKLEDLMVAADRGKAEVLKNAPPSEFVPPPDFNYMTQQHLQPDQTDPAKATLGRQSSFKRNRRKWLTGGREGSQQGTMPPSSQSQEGSPVASSNEVMGYITQGSGWPPKREEPPASKSMRMKSKVLGQRDREALFAQAFPEDAREIGVEAGGDIFDEAADGHGVPLGGSTTGSGDRIGSREGSFRGEQRSSTGSFNNGNGNGHAKKNGRNGNGHTNGNGNGNGRFNGSGKHEEEGIIEHDIAL